MTTQPTQDDSQGKPNPVPSPHVPPSPVPPPLILAPPTLEELRLRNANPGAALDEALEAVTEAFSSTSAGLARAAATIKQLNRDLNRCRSAVARVEGLHESYRSGADEQDYCAHCNQISGAWVKYPCPTIRALQANGYLDDDGPDVH